MATAIAERRPAAEAELMVQYLPLVRRVAHQYNGMLEFEDAVQVGSIGLLEAIRVYDPNGGIPFGTVAHKRVRGRIIDQIRLVYGRERQRYNNTSHLSTYTERQVEDMFGREDGAQDALDAMLNGEVLQEALDQLPQLPRAVILLTFGSSLTVKAIAERWNVPVMLVARYKHEALERLRAILTEVP